MPRITQAEVIVAIAELDEHQANLARLNAEHAELQDRLARLNAERTHLADVVAAATATTHIIAGTPVCHDEETGHVSPVVFDPAFRWAIVYRNVRTHRWNVSFEGRTGRTGLVAEEFDTADDAVAATAALFA